VEPAYTTQAGAGLIAIELKSGKIVHQSPSFRTLTSWVPVEARGNIRVLLEARDGDEFHSFCQSVVRDAGEPYGGTFPDLDQVVGHNRRSITVHFLTRAPGPPGLRNPEWLLMMRAIKLTLVGVQLDGEPPTSGSKLPFFGHAHLPEEVGVFTADLRGGNPQQWTLQVAHVRYLLDLEVASGTYDTVAGNQNPWEQIASVFNFEFSKEGSGGASVLSRAAAQLDYAATRALNIAHHSASWLTRKALKIVYRWNMRIHGDDTVSISGLVLFKLFGGLSFSVSNDFWGGKVGFSHGGLQFLYFVADPAKPLETNLRAALVRIASAKTKGDFDVHHPFVFICAWSRRNFQIFSPMLSIDKGKTKASLNPQLSTFNSQLSSLKPQPSTLNPQPSFLIHNSKTPNPEPSGGKAAAGGGFVPAPREDEGVSRGGSPQRWQRFNLRWTI
jgi:hypothetical protein